MPKQSDKTKHYRLILNGLRVDIQTIERKTRTFFITVYFKINDPRSPKHSTTGQYDGQISNYMHNIIREECKALMKSRQFFLNNHILIVDVPQNCLCTGNASIELTCYLKEEFNFSYRQRTIDPEVIELESIAEELAILVDIITQDTKLAIKDFPVPAKMRKEKEEEDSYEFVPGLIAKI